MSDPKPARKKSTTRTTKTAPKTRATKSPKPKPSSQRDVVTLAELAEEANITPAQARQKLRKADIEREGGKRWEWAPNSRDLKAVRKALDL